MSEETKDENGSSSFLKVAKRLFTPVTKPDPVEDILRKERRRFALGYTFVFFSIPVFTITNKWAFKKFSSFHARKLGLQNKSPTKIALLALFFATLYTSLAIPFYYNGLLRIFGLTEFYDLSGLLTEYYLDGVSDDDIKESKDTKKTEKKP